MQYFQMTNRINSQILKICLLTSLLAYLSQNIGTARSELTPEKLRNKISTLIAADKNNISIRVERLGSNGPIVSINETRPLNPASVMKLVTTKVAIDVLGLDFRWSTQVRRTGEIVHQSLIGDLYFVGDGDPTLDIERLGGILEDIRARGIKSIKGNIYVDRSRFSAPYHNPKIFDEAPTRPYNAGPDALLINENKFTLTFTPRTGDQSVSITSTPPLSKLVNELHLSSGTCVDWPKHPATNQRQIIFSGYFHESCGQKKWRYRFLNHQEYFANAFYSIWNALDGKHEGQILAREAPPDTVLLGTYISEPISAAIRKINKESSNVMARQLFLQLGQQPSKGNRLHHARATINNWAAEHAIDTSSSFIDNGSGLSRYGRVTTKFIAAVLRKAWMDPSMPEFLSSLSIPGVDGTLENKFGLTPLTSRSHLKTGFLKNVRAVAGYIHHDSGQVLSVVIIVNGGALTKNGNLADKILQLIADTDWSQ
jgi:D-alanyl-D-alanine carboxypeptidase/D-alanyl-D-alanine-endopeptidase (penicillin-binding protein 4)